MFCSDCGNEVLAKSTFCHNCGAAMQPSGVQGPGSVGVSRRLLFAGAGVALAVIASVIGVLAVAQPFGGAGEEPAALAGDTETPGSPGPDAETSPPPKPRDGGSEARILYEVVGSYNRTNPDGSREEVEGVYSIRADGSDERKLFSSDYWALSPDATIVAYTEPGDPFTPGRLNLVSVTGERLTSFEGTGTELDSAGITWSPLGGYLLTEPDSSDSPHLLMRVPTEGGEMGKVGEIAESQSQYADQEIKIGQDVLYGTARGFSPDDRLIVETIDGITHLLDLTSGVEVTYPGLAACQPEEKSPNGWLCVKDFEYAAAAGEFRVLSIKQGTSLVVKEPIPTGAKFAWSPDSQSIAFVSETEGGSYTVVAVSIRDGTWLPLTRPSSDKPSDLVWSEDSQRVYFRNIQERTLVQATFFAKVDGSGGQRVEGHRVGYCFTPHGQLLALESEAHAGVTGLVPASRLENDEVAGCRLTADSKFAFQPGDGLRVVDLATGERSARLTASAVKSTAWVGTCASGACPARVTAAALQSCDEYRVTKLEVNRGEPFFEIAEMHDISVADVARLNGKDPTNPQVQVDELLQIPC